MTYQSNAVSRGTPLTDDEAHDHLVAKLDDAARLIRAAAPALDRSDSRLLTDVAGGQGSRMISRMVAISVRSTRDDVSFLVSEALRGHETYLRDAQTACALAVIEALLNENASNGPANVASDLFLIAPSRATKARLAEALHRQWVATRIAKDRLDALPDAKLEQIRPAALQLTA